MKELQHARKGNPYLLLLISPRNENWRVGKNRSLFPTLALPSIAAITPEDVEIKIVDENVEHLSYEYDCDLVGITSVTSTASRAYEIADKFRSKGKKVVLGGIHVSFLPDEALKHADSILIGEAEEAWRHRGAASMERAVA